MDTYFAYALIGALAVGLFFIIWSFADNPAQFKRALEARLVLFMANIGGYTKALAISAASLAYVIFDPIWIIVDDIAVITIAYISIRSILGQIVKDNYPFPKPWKRKR